MASGSTLTMASSPLSTMHTSIIESMPSDIIVKILEYAELRATVLLASRSNVMHNIVFQHRESSWVNIDFDGHSAISRPMRPTDTMLASLLVRVNARKITQSLTLFCTEKTSRIWSGSAHFVSKATVASSRPKRGKRRVRHEYSLTHFAYNDTIQSFLCSLWILEATAAFTWSADRLERRQLPQRPSYGQAQTGSGSTDQV
jgi:hypothetical protein